MVTQDSEFQVILVFKDRRCSAGHGCLLQYQGEVLAA